MMEVSSENGHNAGDDIDIDLDLTAGHVDEDYMLDDAASTIGMVDDLQPPPYPAAGNDESMLDEDDEQYNVQDEDLNEEFVLGEGTDSMEHEAISMSFDNAEPSVNHIEENRIVNSMNPTEASDKAIRNPSEPTETIKKTSTEINRHIHGPEIVTGTEGVNDTSRSEGERVADSSHNTPRVASPRSQTPTLTDHLKSSPVASSGSQEKAAHQPIVESETIHISEESARSPDVLASFPNLSSREIVVLYQDSEYALFSSSELDDPDSFFLSDLSIMEKPLSTLFKEIRGVIQEDLADIDELSIAVEDLGLEIMENEAPDQDITFSQILELRSKLLQNDGVDSPGPLHLLLATRTNFSRKFASLFKSAAEGKGLSEVVHWDEQSESLEFEDIGEAQLGDELVVDGREDTGDELDNLQDEPVDPPLSRSPIKSNDTQGSAQAQESEPIDTATSKKVETLSGGNADATSSVEQDEEGDLIDYSDEELEINHKKAESKPSKLPIDSSRTHNGAEIPAKDELSQRSITRAVEDTKLEQEVEKTEGPEKDHHTETALGAEGGVDYDEDDYHEDSESGYLNAEHDNPLIENGEVNINEVQAQSHNDEPPLDNDVNDRAQTHGDLEETSSNPDFRNGLEPDEHEADVEISNGVFDDGLEFGEDDFVASEEHPDVPDGDPSTNNGAPSGDVHTPSTGPAELDLEAPGAGSETAGSDRTLEALSALETEQEDEIDYDDDDDEKFPLEAKSVPSDLNEVPTPQTGPGKRPRTEEASDEGMVASSKEAKRRRS